MHKTDLSKYNRTSYYCGAKIIRRIFWYYINILIVRNTLNPCSSLKVWILKLFGAKIGKGVVIKPGVNIKYPWLLSIGNYTWIGENVWIDNLAQVSIGDDVCVSQGAMLLCGNHDYRKTTFDLIVRPISLEEGCWVGAQSTVCPGVTMHTHSILAVGSVTSKNLEAYGVYRGNPAVRVTNRIISET